MPKSKPKRLRAKAVSKATEPDGLYLLKLVFYLIVGTQWVKFVTASNNQVPIPIGLLLGILFASHEHFQIDRKIEYAVLMIAMLIGFWSQIGIYIKL